MKRQSAAPPTTSSRSEAEGRRRWRFFPMRNEKFKTDVFCFCRCRSGFCFRGVAVYVVAVGQVSVSAAWLFALLLSVRLVLLPVSALFLEIRSHSRTCCRYLPVSVSAATFLFLFPLLPFCFCFRRYLSVSVSAATFLFLFPLLPSCFCFRRYLSVSVSAAIFLFQLAGQFSACCPPAPRASRIIFRFNFQTRSRVC
ncbi:hypothetical protein MmiHf6_11090 [Methanimicrococcus hongohii]|uniref:Transmembrane protein n=2 Tax=Methanimicrococcus hongohii TaxID=3028295 RepID=A0AA96V2B7_9EURY|nr:hypothetical protein MmiHf6_11090 [Methanimicrococcus sp. Hf6]